MLCIAVVSQRETVFEQSVLLSEAYFAMEHAVRLKRLAQHRPIRRPFQRRVRALEEAASRMELEARALAIRHWRAQPRAFSSPVSNEGFIEMKYLDEPLVRQMVVYAHGCRPGCRTSG